MRFTLNGQQIELTAEDVQDRLRNVSPGPIQEYGIWIGSVLYPVKQAFEGATGVARRSFTTQVARRHLAALAFEVVATGRPRPAAATPDESARVSQETAAPVTESPVSSDDWHTEAQVQAMVIAHLVRRVADHESCGHGQP
jgi:hypothetical protein